MNRMHILLSDELKRRIAVRPSSAANLLQLADRARSTQGRGPSDLSVNYDYYAWGGRKRGNRK